MPPDATQPDFRRLFEAAPALFMVLAPDPPRFTILAASDAYLRAVQKRRDELVGRPVFEALPVPPEDPSAEANSRASFERAIALRVPDTMAVQRHDVKRPGTDEFQTKYWSPVNTPVLGEDGAVRYVLHRVEDVTEFVQAQERGREQRALAERLETRAGAMEREIWLRAQEIQRVNASLREANDRLGALDRAKTAFFSNVSHELRTPLTLVLGTLEELCARNDLPAGTVAELTVARRNALRLLRLVNALLEFSRIEAGRAEATFRPTDVGALTAELASGFQSACEKAGLRLRIDCPPPRAPAYVDPELWEKVVLNLLSNALKFTFEGEIAVAVRDLPDGLELAVRDTGTGIPAEELPRIFERFHRVPSARSRSIEGTGIGLSLVKELVALHGGDVRVESEVGRGSTFRVTLPAGAAHLPADRVAQAPAARRSSDAPAFAEEAARWVADEDRPADAAGPGAGGAPPREGAARPRVLVADDNADLRGHVARLLAARFEVLVARDGLEALATAQRTRPDLVLSDVMMPGLDGFGLVRALRADPNLRATPVILLSALAGEEGTGEGLGAGADDYLVKPFSARELLARVGSNLALARTREEAARAAAREEALRDNDERKDRFLAMLSHELRNPLAPIRNSLYVLAHSVPGGEQARRAQLVIDRQVAHLSRLVDDLLDVSRITQGKLQVQKERVELDELVRGVVEDARPRFVENGVTLEAAVEGGPLLVTGDPVRLAQVVSNLLANAAKFSHPGGHAWVRLRPEGAGEAVLSVRDDGAGMQKDVLQHLFRPFVQADRTLERSAGGLGLGLAIVHGLVEAHGGTVSARSEGPGQGAELTVRLPLRERVQPHLALVPAPRDRPPPRRVLIVEDNRDAAQSLKDALELSGHEVEVAHDGEAGVRHARAWRPDAVVSDIGMPRLDGYGVARAIRSDPGLRRVCLVAITGYAALDDVERSRAAGFDHHLPKPPDLGALEAILASCAEASAAP